jgi:hypothetical protein
MNITKVCQVCWAKIRPGDYFPGHVGYGTCSACGDTGLAARVAAADISALRQEWERCTGLNDTCILTDGHLGPHARPN